MTEKIPILIQIVDEEEKVMSFFKTIRLTLELMRYSCLVTTQKVNVLLYKSGENKFF